MKTATQKFGFEAKKVYTSQGGEIDDIKLIRDDDILYIVGENEKFIPLDQSQKNYAPSVVLQDPVKKECGCSSSQQYQTYSNKYDLSNFSTIDKKG